MPRENQYRIRTPGGVDRRTPETELVTYDQYVGLGSVRGAVNADMYPNGQRWRRRAGQALINATSAHSAWSHPALPFALYVRGDGQICSIDTARTITALVAVNPALPMSWHEFNARAYYTNGHDLGYIDAAGTPGLLTLETPPAPLCAASVNGGLWAGNYRVAYTAVFGGGVESATNRFTSVEVAQDGGITVGPVPLHSDVTEFRIYRTEADDAVLRLAAVAAPGTASVTLSQGTFLGEMLDPALLHAVPLRPGSLIGAYNRRLYVVRGRYLEYSTEASVGYRAHENWLAFPDEITCFGASEDGIYVGTLSRTWWLAGSDPEEFRRELVDNHGAIRRYSQVWLPGNYLQPENVRDSGHLHPWWNTNGELLFGRPGGVVQRQGEQLALPPYVQSDMVWRRSNGLWQLLSTLKQRQGPDNRIAPGYDTGTVYSHGITLT